MTTKESNRIIAEFLYPKWRKPNLNDNITGELFEACGESYFVIATLLQEDYERFNYHKSWDALMPVVEKINSTTDEFDNPYDFKIGNGYVWVLPHIGGRIFFSGNDINHREELLISKVYRGVVRFIQWHNLQNEKPNKTQ